MDYHSTRNDSQRVNSAQAVLLGLAGDGGLFVPDALPEFDWQDALTGTAQDTAAKLLSALLPDIPDMKALVHNAYTGKFQTESLTPTVPVGDYTVLELFRGPTSAFKDVALRMLPQLMTAAAKALGDTRQTMILTATSGDTGKAALEGFRDVPGIRICVFYPEGGVSLMQRSQMVTQEGSNVTVCAVRGNFDDAQTGVKEIFAAARGMELPFRLSSANSINIGRLAPQLTYYFRSYRDLLDRGVIRPGEKVNFSVPTGNFGDILAGYLAKQLGLPVGMLICASNANNVLTDFIHTGVYDRRRELIKTASPSMDILVSSNLERLLYFLYRDTDAVAALMQSLKESGVYRVSPEVLGKIQASFYPSFADDNRCLEVIGRVYRDYGYLCDPHTASGWAAAEDYVRSTGDHRPMVVLSTASPYKFPAAVLSALGTQALGDEFRQMEQLREKTGIPIPGNLSKLAGKPQRFSRVIDPKDMLSFVADL